MKMEVVKFLAVWYLIGFVFAMVRLVIEFIELGCDKSYFELSLIHDIVTLTLAGPVAIGAMILTILSERQTKVR